MRDRFGSWLRSGISGAAAVGPGTSGASRRTWSGRAGAVSGRNEDKIAALKLKLARGIKVKTPHLAAAVGFVECRVVKTVLIAGVRVVMGRVVGSYVRPRYWKENRISPRARTSHHLGGGLYAETGRQFR